MRFPTTLVLVRAGSPVERGMLVDTACRVGAGLFAMATRGRSGVGRTVLGGVADTVVRAAPCPVLMVRIHAGDWVEAANRDASGR